MISFQYDLVKPLIGEELLVKANELVEEAVGDIVTQSSLASKGNKAERQQAYRVLRKHIVSRTATESELDLLARSEMTKIRRLVAWSKDLSIESLAVLKRDADINVADIAQNLRTLSNQLQFCSYNQILERIKRSDIDHYDLELLSSSNNRDVLYEVAKCFLTSQNTLAKLAEVPDADIRYIALTRLGHYMPVWSLDPRSSKCDVKQVVINAPSFFLAVLSPSSDYYSPELLKELICRENSDELGLLADLESWVTTKPPNFEISMFLSGENMIHNFITPQQRLILNIKKSGNLMIYLLFALLSLRDLTVYSMLTRPHRLSTNDRA